MEKKSSNSVINLGTLVPVLGFTVVLPLLAGSLTIIPLLLLVLFSTSTFILANKLTNLVNFENQALTTLLPIIGCYIISVFLFPVLIIPSNYLGVIVISILVIGAFGMAFRTTQYSFTLDKEILLTILLL